MSNEEILQAVDNVSHNLHWRDIERLCRYYDWKVVNTRRGYKVYINSSVWCLHLEHRTSNQLKHGIIRNFRKVLKKEKIL